MKHADVAIYIYIHKEAQRIRLVGNNVRIAEERTVKRVTECRPVAVRVIGRQRLRRRMMSERF